MQEPLSPPPNCPVCGSTEFLLINCRAVGQHADSQHASIHGVLSYKCSNGHVFLPRNPPEPETKI